MKVLLVRPVNKVSILTPNLGLGYLASAVRRGGHHVELLDCVQEKMDFDAFDGFLKDKKYDVIGFQVFSYDLYNARRQMEISRKRLPRAVLCAGGPHPSGDPEGTMDTLVESDYAVAGEAEIAFPGLLAALDAGGSLEGVPNLIWRKNGRVQQNPVSFVHDLDRLGFPAWDLIDPRTYPLMPIGIFVKNTPIAPIVITRGCPCRCTFCAGRRLTGRKLRKRSVENAVEEIEYLVHEFGIRELHLQDENFTFHKNYVIKFCELLQKRDLKITWCCPGGIRLNTLDKELLQVMEKAGCYAFAVGIESASPRILKLMRKDLDLEQVEEKIDLIKSVTDIQITGFFIMGYPGETPEEMGQTAAFSRRLKIDKANFGSFMPLPGSANYEDLIRQGQRFDHRWDRMSEYQVPYVPEGMTEKQLRRVIRNAFIRFYCRPKLVLSALGGLRSFDQIRSIIHRIGDMVRA
jgi:radical SAM superfamily enzyme YgiQ (UPF0313 family)